MNTTLTHQRSFCGIKAIIALMLFIALAAPLNARIPPIVAPGVLRIGTLTHVGITESSGIVASRRFANVLWTHNDGGHQFLFAVLPNGRAIRAFPVVGANLIDWEDIAMDDAGNLYLADIGTNGMVRSHVAVHQVREPNPSRLINVQVERTWLVHYPGAVQDSEAFFVHQGYGYIITKKTVRGIVRMYRFSLADRRRSIPLEFVTFIPMADDVTAADLSADGDRLGLVSDEGVDLFFVNGNPGSAGSAERTLAPFENDFMEGGTFFGPGFLTSAETRELWLFTNEVFRCDAPPQFTLLLTNRAVVVGASVRFETRAIGCPAPGLQWSHNGQPILGATNTILNLTNVTLASAGQYEVSASNRHRVIFDTATLTVRSKPNVRITEVLPRPADDATVSTEDWWELTNFEAVPLDLTDWRFNDSSGGLSDALVMMNGPVVGPGETVVFVEELTPEEFRAWWGSENLPATLQIVTYTGGGLSFSATGDALLLWDAAAIDPADTVDRAAFGAADPGISFIYDPATQQFGARSELGVNGAVQAEASSDIGSPGGPAGPE